MIILDQLTFRHLKAEQITRCYFICSISFLQALMIRSTCQSSERLESHSASAWHHYFIFMVQSIIKWWCQSFSKESFSLLRVSVGTFIKRQPHFLSLLAGFSLVTIEGVFVCLYVCPLISSTTVHLIDFTLQGCNAEDWMKFGWSLK